MLNGTGPDYDHTNSSSEGYWLLLHRMDSPAPKVSTLMVNCSLCQFLYVTSIPFNEKAKCGLASL